jgi:hypothetical protein
MMADTKADNTATTAEACVDVVIGKVGKRIVLGLPVGLGKPVRLTNALNERARSDCSIELHIVTAFEFLFEDPHSDYPLFPVPQTAISPADHMVGFYTSTLQVATRFPFAPEEGGTKPFRERLYGCSGKMLGGFIDLMIKRQVYDNLNPQPGEPVLSGSTPDSRRWRRTWSAWSWPGPVGSGSDLRHAC